ncbi:uncharacterized protein LOC125655326 [Ostrea edulis]|uniref:uncharacterized protein LOC125655326 n=1 Tax=Ostrea edulis TaxID=37623 RepID=UPI0024AF9314|nr:uncharacterized protein LOC125655326 [Ostrea edulis]XP_055999457.1 uncharacterized protein LOC125655326 [Ostrea edulis]
MKIERRHPTGITCVLGLALLSILNAKCVLGSFTNDIDCLAKILSRYRDIRSCPWDITSTCSATNLGCYKYEKDCEVSEQGPTHVSMFVYISTIPVVEEHKSVQSQWCRCRVVTFVCYLSIDNAFNISDLCLPKTTAPMPGSSGSTTNLTAGSQTVNTCQSNNGNSPGQIVGAFIGGAAFTVIVVFLTYFLTKRCRHIQSGDKVPSERSTTNPAYESESNLVSLDHNLRSRSINNGHTYCTINDHLPSTKVSHVKPIVRHEHHPVPPSVKQDNINNIYNHLNETEGDDKSVYYDHVSPSTTSVPPSVEYDVFNNYTEVVGEGYVHASGTHKN